MWLIELWAQKIRRGLVQRKNVGKEWSRFRLIIAEGKSSFERPDQRAEGGRVLNINEDGRKNEQRVVGESVGWRGAKVDN